MHNSRKEYEYDKTQKSGTCNWECLRVRRPYQAVVGVDY